MQSEGQVRELTFQFEQLEISVRVSVRPRSGTTGEASAEPSEVVVEASSAAGPESSIYDPYSISIELEDQVLAASTSTELGALNLPFLTHLERQLRGRVGRSDRSRIPFWSRVSRCWQRRGVRAGAFWTTGRSGSCVGAHCSVGGRVDSSSCFRSSSKSRSSSSSFNNSAFKSNSSCRTTWCRTAVVRGKGAVSDSGRSDSFAKTRGASSWKSQTVAKTEGYSIGSHSTSRDCIRRSREGGCRGRGSSTGFGSTNFDNSLRSSSTDASCTDAAKPVVVAKDARSTWQPGADDLPVVRRRGQRVRMARDMYLKTVQDLPRVAEVARLNALQELGITADREDKDLMHLYIERRVPLSENKLLAHFAVLAAEGWSIAHGSNNIEMKGFLARVLFVIEQVALDGGKLELGWLLGGFPEPNTHLHFSVKRTPGLKPFSRLVSPIWLSANLAFLRDLDYMQGRIQTIGTGKQHVATGQPQEESDAPNPKRRPRPKKKQKGG